MKKILFLLCVSWVITISIRAQNVGIDIPSPNAKLSVARGTGVDGTAAFWGTDNVSHFNYNIQENTYIRGGKVDQVIVPRGSDVFINDLPGWNINTNSPQPGGNVLLANGGGNVGIGVDVPTYKLEVAGETKITGTSTFDLPFGPIIWGALSVHDETNLHLLMDGNSINAVNNGSGEADFLRLCRHGGGVQIGLAGVGSSDATLSVARGAGMNGTAMFRGTTHISYFNFGTNEDTFIRGGKSGSSVVINDTHNGNVYIAEGGGNVGIGTNNLAYKFNVNGTIRSKEIVVESNWADYVFDDTYALPSLHSVEQFIQQHHHLPNMPAASDVEDKGLPVGEVQTKMMEKIEELTLYIIDLHHEIETMKETIDQISSTSTNLKEK